MIFKQKAVGSLRLYTEKEWDISERDLETLYILAELIAMALKYAKFFTTISTIKEIVEEVQDI